MSAISIFLRCVIYHWKNLFSTTEGKKKSFSNYKSRWSNEPQLILVAIFFGHNFLLMHTFTHFDIIVIFIKFIQRQSLDIQFQRCWIGIHPKLFLQSYGWKHSCKSTLDCETILYSNTKSLHGNLLPIVALDVLEILRSLFDVKISRLQNKPLYIYTHTLEGTTYRFFKSLSMKDWYIS